MDQGAPEDLQSLGTKRCQVLQKAGTRPRARRQEATATLFFPGRDQKLSGEAEVKVLWTPGYLSQQRVTVRKELENWKAN